MRVEYLTLRFRRVKYEEGRVRYVNGRVRYVKT